MQARSGTYHVDPEHFAEALAHFATDEVRAYLQSSGARGGLLLGNRKTGKLLGVSFWDSPEGMEATEPEAQQLRTEVQSIGKGTDPIVREDWEILSINWDGDANA